MDLIKQISKTPGMIPVNIDAITGMLTWRDLSTYHMYEGNFRQSLQFASALQRTENSNEITTPFDVLNEVQVDNVSPDIMIFHLSRCGSTLLARSLAQSRQNNVFGEPAILLGLWYFLHKKGNTNDFRTGASQLLSCLLRKRLATHKRNIVKFSSLETFLLPVLVDLYPNSVPVFIYRDPVEILVSLYETPPQWLQSGVDPWRQDLSEQQAIKQENTIRSAIEILSSIMNEVIESETSRLKLIHYPDLISQNMPFLLESFQMDLPDQDIERMCAIFSVHSKRHIGDKTFSRDSEHKRARATKEMRELCDDKLGANYHALLESERNIFPQA